MPITDIDELRPDPETIKSALELVESIHHRVAEREILNALLSKLIGNRKFLPSGQLVHALGFLIGVHPCKTQAEFAAFNSITEARASQIIRDLPSDFAWLANLNARQKRHRI